MSDAALPCPYAPNLAPTQPVAVITTIDDAEQARTMARALVEQRLAACVQISPIDSVYRWDGAVVESQEWRLSCKTRWDLQERLQQAIRALHSYDVPELHLELLLAADPAYAHWLQTETAVDDGP